MADRVSASIVIGGSITATDFAKLVEIIGYEQLSVEWDGEPFKPEHHVIDEPLSLYAHEVAWGRFEELEDYCQANKLCYSRWSGAYACQWGAQRVVFTGEGEPTSYAADDDDYIVITREIVDELGSIEAIRAHFDAADFTIPPLIISNEPALTTTEHES